MSNLNNNKRGRPSKDYVAPDGTEHKGLYRRSDGRWIIKSIGETFTQHDPRLAVMYFLKKTAPSKDVIIQTPVDEYPGLEILADTLIENGIKNIEIKLNVESDIFWRYVRESIITRSAYVANRTGLPQLANFSDMEMPGQSAKFTDLIEIYNNKINLEKESRSKAVKVVEDFIKITGCKTLRDATNEILEKYKKAILSRSNSTSTTASTFIKLKTVVNCAPKIYKKDIASFLERADILPIKYDKAGDALPNPISRNDYQTLLSGADPEMRAVILLALNCGMYLAEVLKLTWANVNLDQKFMLTRRSKKEKIIRTATLWDETINALSVVQRKGLSPYIFTSSHGKNYNRKTYGNKFRRYCKAIKLIVEFNQLRDAAYSAAASNNISFAACQILAGHKCPGMSDHYISRNPELVRPACDAVYSKYAPFSDSCQIVKIGRPKK